MKYSLQFLILFTLLISGTITHLCAQEVPASLKAFPGAEGYGSFASGGRGGRVIEVINLNDSGHGSLREAIETTGPRTIVFKISGIIRLNSPLTIKKDDITIAGQTAPGDGICLSNYSLFLEGDNIVLRFIRCRMGDLAKYQDDAIHGLHGKNSIVDHCSFSWSIDETASFYDRIENLTVQWCIISESLNNSVHQKGEHGYGGIWGGIKTTFHHNLFAHHTSRTPRFNNGNNPNKDEYVDCVNNVMYNWGLNSTYGGEEGNHNLCFNYYKPGPATRENVRDRIIEPYDTAANWYVYGNFMEGSSKITSENWNGGVQGKYAEYNKKKRMLAPFPSAAVTIQTPQEAYTSILKNVGACVPKRDIIDERVLNETKTGTAKYGKLWDGGRNGIIDSQNDVGGWPVLNSLPAPLDSDHDGMPDEWEKKNGLNSENPLDRNIANKDGYTMLEVYLNSLVEHVIK